ncbi:hypothetical protein ASPZODRAFT_57817 [Penicilliopsis zonata CBS 506.65]|uniref:Dienelactone hydrolase domain-containing protein n=1 Tax=Penicilliopsis zonata CBS 506.65 TaxID=1073090 RepID=A0A1L9SSM2_9EURO|nr:hypothetical protein ASPZODRAFT_57817 [Penicilliopsis zonata CBS 506.65]OJJ50198.1 hypothetical protein ASPZODRAFT_57817 [Penicilliopsis zonata CBS 506.65]
MSEYSKACCTAPLAVVGEYVAKGKYIDFNGMKTYVTGPPTATKAIIFIYDVFGYTPQTVQGADILASGGPYLVLVPDLLVSNYVEPEWVIPPQSEEVKEKLAAFRARITAPETWERVTSTVTAFKTAPEYASITRWAGIGYCWGGKMVSLLTSKGVDSPLDVGVQTSPAMVNPDEAKTVTVPSMMLASKDEDAALVQAYGLNLAVQEKHVETFNQIHGWMSGRAQLDEEEPRKEYERGYRVVIDFLHKHL